jgi:hypothetical protein
MLNQARKATVDYLGTQFKVLRYMAYSADGRTLWRHFSRFLTIKHHIAVVDESVYVRHATDCTEFRNIVQRKVTPVGSNL